VSNTPVDLHKHIYFDIDRKVTILKDGKKFTFRPPFYVFKKMMRCCEEMREAKKRGDEENFKHFRSLLEWELRLSLPIHEENEKPSN